MLLGQLTCSAIRINPFFRCLSILSSLQRTPCHIHQYAATVIPSASLFLAAVTSRSFRRQNKPRFESPENTLRRRLEVCSENRDVASAFSVFDEARVAGVRLCSYHYNSLLYLCSLPTSLGNWVDRGFEIYDRMRADGVPPNEATITNLTRLAAEKGDFDLAFNFLKQMPEYGLTPRLRSFGPALYGFCRLGKVEKAYEVDEYMLNFGIVPEESELSALLQASSEAGRGDKVYSILHRLRRAVWEVSESTAEILERWFRSKAAAKVGVENWDTEEVRMGIVEGGGGWHGKGWLGKGDWKVAKSKISEKGVCKVCGERLVTIDIDPRETENFAKSIADLACEKQVKNDFTKFQDWLEKNGPFDAVIDGANMGHFKPGLHVSSFSRLNSVVNALHKMSPSKKLPLVILHSWHLKGDAVDRPEIKHVIESWRRSRAIYTTPVGSNDDWYWLYAAVSCRCLLVTNDEMRDHLFQLLGKSFFPTWKERHQVRLSASKRLKFQMPLPYSTVIQVINIFLV
ncbi:Proteinaceous RNase P 1 [Nymphaea thermarum]|nr:Proteinaceous RNase P 1 [Nymphaea thermarum]